MHVHGLDDAKRRARDKGSIKRSCGPGWERKAREGERKGNLKRKTEDGRWKGGKENEEQSMPDEGSGGRHLFKKGWCAGYAERILLLCACDSWVAKDTGYRTPVWG